jgi:hypothetical protein
MTTAQKSGKRFLAAVAVVWDACVLGAVFLVASTVTAAVQLNCKTQQCTVVGYQDDGQGRNKLCFYMTIAGKEQSRAYSDLYADYAYGQDSQGGTRDSYIDGFYVNVVCKSDCIVGGVPLNPSSGTVINYLSNPKGARFPTKCMQQGGGGGGS